MISKEAESELQQIEEGFAGHQAGTVDPDDFKRFRLENGVYGIRQTTDKFERSENLGVREGDRPSPSSEEGGTRGNPRFPLGSEGASPSDEFMVRVKIRFGALNPEQLERLAEIAEKYTPLKVGHITTRQDIQFHRVKTGDVPLVLRKLAEVGLTTREACGNTVRNVTCCPYAGISPEEAFDVTPYADQVSRYFLRNPVCQNLPRKFKIAFEGCRTDHARVAIHDLGVVATWGLSPKGTVPSERGFRLYVGGGLGPAPMTAQLLEAFTPAELLIPSIEAVLRLFDRHGDRAHKDRARIKFLLKDWGIEEFRKRWEAERKIVLSTASGTAQTQWVIQPKEEGPPRLEEKPVPPQGSLEGYEGWLKTNVLAQKQNGYATVTIRCPLGDVAADEMKAVAQLARQFCGGRIRTSIGQNLLLRWVPEGHLPNLYAGLSQAHLAHAGAETLNDITRCPGADTCNLGITHSRGLAAAFGELFSKGPEFSDPAISQLSIKISGCPNSCGQHHIADIGFYGTAKAVDGHSVPHYQMLLGGGTEEGYAGFGKVVARIPAKRVPEAVRHLLKLYQQGRQDTEPFRLWVERAGVPKLQQELLPFTTIVPYSEQPALYEDLGAPGEFKVQTGKGECAA